MYQQNKDLILITFFGFIYYAIVVGLNGHMTKVPLGEYFIAPFALSLLFGIAIRTSSQLIEWPLCFLFGGTLASILLMTVLSFLGMPYTFQEVAFTISSTMAWFGIISITMLTGMFLGAFFKLTYNLIMGSLNITIEK